MQTGETATRVHGPSLQARPSTQVSDLRSGHSARKSMPFVKPMFRDFATLLVKSGLALWAGAV